MTSSSNSSEYVVVPSHPHQLKHAKIRINPSHLANPSTPPISDLIYAGFLEHLGRCIYGGLVDDPSDPSPGNLLEKQDQAAGLSAGRLGWRKDVMELIGAKGDLEVPMLRWPGGNFVSNYHWQDGVGPVDSRPRRVELAWLSEECNKFGTDEYIDYCRASGCEPYICLNMGTGTLQEALAWLEYCNGTSNTYWANLRRKNTGRDEPHNVRYWGLGNEMWGPWQVGNISATEYAERARIWAHGLRLVDPSIILVSCGKEGNTEWDATVLKSVAGFVDMHSIHFYTMLNQEFFADARAHEYENNVFGPAAAERSIEICKGLIDMVNTERMTRVDPMTAQPLPIRDIKIAFDEWNIWDLVKAPGSAGLKQVYDYTDLLGFVAWLSVLVRKHKDLGLACLAQTVNVISPILTSSSGLLKQTTYYPLRLFSRYMKNGHLLSIHAGLEVYTGPTYPAWIQQMAKPTYVDIVGIVVPPSESSGKSSIRLSVLNRHPNADFPLDLKFDDFEVDSVEVHEMYSADLSAANTFEDPHRVVPLISKLSAKEWESKEHVVRKHSWKFFIIGGTQL